MTLPPTFAKATAGKPAEVARKDCDRLIVGKIFFKKQSCVLKGIDKVFGAPDCSLVEYFVAVDLFTLARAIT